MKTWEVYKSLTEDRNKKFRRKIDGEVYFLDDADRLQPVDLLQPGKSFPIPKKLDEEWEEVKEPVTWQKAIQAWVEGKDIYVECCDEHGSPIEMDICALEDAVYLTKSMLTKGNNWYIK